MPKALMLSLLSGALLLFTSTPTLAVSPINQIKTQLKPTIQALRQDTREQFKEKLAQIKDTRKQALVTKIDTRIQDINTKRTQQMTDSLTKLSTLLDKAVSKSATLTPTPSQDKVTTARAAIAASQQAVTAQAAKQYTMTITSDTALKTDAMTTLTTFRTDLMATHQTVLQAKTAVIDAIKELEPASSREPSGTPTGEGQ